MIEDLDLLEVSILDCQPAYIATSIEQRGDETLIFEQRIEEFTSQISDNSTAIVPEEEEKEKEKKEEKREVDYSLFEKELTILKMRGSTPYDYSFTV